MRVNVLMPLMVDENRESVKRGDNVLLRCAYVDLCGRLEDGLLLSQIMYWFGPDTNGQSKLKVQHDGHTWLAKRYEDWWGECRLTARAARRAIERMVEAELLFKAIYHFGGKPTVHIRPNMPVIDEKLKVLSDRTGQIEVPLMCPEWSEPCDPTGQNHVTPQVISYTEITTETTTNTTLAISDSEGGVEIAADPAADAAQADPVSPSKSSTPQQAMFEAICQVWGYGLDTLTPSRKREIGGVAKELVAARADPAQMPAFKRWLDAKAAQEQWKAYTVNAMKKYWPDFVAATTPPPRVVHKIPDGWLETQHERTLAWYKEHREMIENLPEVRAAQKKAGLA